MIHKYVKASERFEHAIVNICTMVDFILPNTVAKAYQKDYIRTKHSAVTSQLPGPRASHSLIYLSAGTRE